MTARPVSLVCMPWHMLGSPSIQIGTLEALLREAGIPARSHSLFLEFQIFLARRGHRGFSIDDYGAVCSRWENVGVGEWVFAGPPAREASAAKDERYAALLREQGMSHEKVEELRRLRALVPEFLDLCAEEILSGRPAVVGFTSVYSQTWPSAALAHALKSRDPSLTILLGGASAEGPMGPALLRAFPPIDVVVRGEAEGVLVELVESLRAGDPVPRLPGLCFRSEDGIVEVPNDHRTPAAMDRIPIPIYDEYFERLARSPLAATILPQVPFESSRGCWWGMKSHCTFCGLNGLDMRFRSKSPERVIEEVSTLASRHGVLDFTAVDNIMDMGYFSTLLPRLADRGQDFSFFYETKANLTEAQVRSFRDAGVRAIQPGIESLSTPILKLMRKGVTAFQNLRLLKWCAQYGIRVLWNLIYGFPRESPEEYERMADLVPSLVHLPPPALSELAVYRFSPYHLRPAEHGLRLSGPLPYYRLLHDVGEECLRDLAQVFEYAHVDGRDPRSYVRTLRERVEQWNRDEPLNRGALHYRRGPGFLVITDSRTTTAAKAARYTLEGAEATAYLACASGGTRGSIAAVLRERPGPSLSDSQLDAFLRDLVEARLAYEEDGRILSLALPSGADSMPSPSDAGLKCASP